MGPLKALHCLVEEGPYAAKRKDSFVVNRNFCEPPYVLVKDLFVDSLCINQFTTLIVEKTKYYYDVKNNTFNLSLCFFHFLK